MEKGTPTDFLKAFGFKGQYNGLVTRKIDARRIARIGLSKSNGRKSLPTHGHYVSLKVEIVDIHDGPIDSEIFCFDDHLDATKRKDKRTGDYPPQGTRTYMVIDHCGWEWYIVVPRSTKPLTKAVGAYIALFEAEDGQGEGGKNIDFYP